MHLWFLVCYWIVLNKLCKRTKYFVKEFPILRKKIESMNMSTILSNVGGYEFYLNGNRSSMILDLRLVMWPNPMPRNVLAKIVEHELRSSLNLEASSSPPMTKLILQIPKCECPNCSLVAISDNQESRNTQSPISSLLRFITATTMSSADIQ